MNKGICPVCNGTKRVPVLDTQRKYVDIYRFYDKDTDTLPCGNCGGQTMSGISTGEVDLKPDGTPCKHEYEYILAGRCYHKYTCKHCGNQYFIDSGD